METSDGYEIISYKICPKLPYNTPGIAYTLVKIPDDPSQVVATFTCNMKFVVKDCDPNTGEPDNEEGYQDEYALENVEINVSDHVQKVLKPNFGASWEEVGAENELEDTYALSMPSLEEAIKNIIALYSKSGQETKALHWGQQLLKIEPHNHYLQLELENI